MNGIDRNVGSSSLPSSYLIYNKMQQHLIKQESDNQEPSTDNERFGTFREFRKQAGSFGTYQKRLFLLMGCYWITASFFLILPFYFFKRPVYCSEPYSETHGCLQCLHQCVQRVCNNNRDNIYNYVLEQNTLTHRFGLFCDTQPWRVFYKICPQSLSCIGLLIYGAIGDRKGRKVAFKISWRFYTIGLLFFTVTQTQFLISFGYIIACINCFPSLVIQFVLLFEQIGNQQDIQVLIRSYLDRSLRLKACYLLLSFLLIAPLFASFLAGYLVKIGFKTTLLVLCTVPAIILSFITNWLQESAIYAYKDNKLLAYNIINNIAKINKQSPITIDLSKSTWLKYDHYQLTTKDVLSHSKLRSKLLMSIFFMLTLFFNNRLAQISLDQFTNQYLRGTIMNSTSAIATITVIILITKYQINRYTYFGVILCFVSLANLIVAIIGADRFLIDSIVSILLRYVSDLSYSLFLIYTIETFPTVCRAQCLAFTLCGSSLGVMLAYSLSSYPIVQLLISLCFSIVMMVKSKQIHLDYQNKLMDTLTDQYYDLNDSFKRV